MGRGEEKGKEEKGMEGKVKKGGEVKGRDGKVREWTGKGDGKANLGKG